MNVKGTDMDEINLQFDNKKILKVELGELGTQIAQYVTIAPESSISNDYPHVLFIPGMTNDLFSIESTIKEIARTGRKITCITYPDSLTGQVTAEFTKNVENTIDYEPHTNFYLSAINKLHPNNTNLELWGYSTGSSIICELLTDPTFSSRVKNAILLHPASTINQRQFDLSMGVLKDAFNYLNSNPKKLLNYLKTALKLLMNQNKGQLKLKSQIFISLVNKAKVNNIQLHAIRVQPEGTILIVSSQKDCIVKTNLKSNEVHYSNNEIFSKNSQFKTITIYKGTHYTIIHDPRPIVSQIIELIGN
ncbi:MAG: hypothetical protein M3P33_04490 [bacterium]|nr:hypothetical protein [bacterium]